MGFSFNNFSFSHLYGVQNAIQIRGSEDIGSKNFIKFWNNFFSIIILGFILMSIGVVLVTFSFDILVFLRFPSSLIPHISSFVKKMCIGIIML